MWYAVETAFVDGKLLGSHCCFKDDDTTPVGHCNASWNEEPYNSCEKKFGDRIEIHVDWFETAELAHAFCDGKVTYITHCNAYYDKSIKTTLTKYHHREIVDVDHTKHYPHRGEVKLHMLKEKPDWVR
ncbi:hypothetical protein LKD70_14910 [Ruminococcus sp. CLA-AA-H200]|uniref:Uncharacterized protein n=1 Tax=Ruminococcus turbiniformis TaxID=2881258 RepID=A0ABS8G099_9FIRM|nr:hypothetical protein [Ruminococcus turbiniformis]MCC2255683.1 hypothetical protein [Ruminococcus turbiniformis]